MDLKFWKVVLKFCWSVGVVCLLSVWMYVSPMLMQTTNKCLMIKLQKEIKICSFWEQICKGRCPQHKKCVEFCYDPPNRKKISSACLQWASESGGIEFKQYLKIIFFDFFSKFVISIKIPVCTKMPIFTTKTTHSDID